VNDDTGRLVHDEHVRIRVDDRERDGLRRQRLRLEGGRLRLDVLSSRKPEALRPDLAVDADGGGAQKLFRRAPRADFGSRGQEAVEPRPRRFVRNA
jgi:hypothetical protein